MIAVMEPRRMRVLVVEDEPKVAEALRDVLVGEQYDVVVVGTGSEAFRRASSEHFDALVLDIMLPERDGLDVLTSLRARGDTTPVLILTAKDTVDDRVLGLDSGADDYLVKPFAVTELVARVRALLRRGRNNEMARVQVAGLEIDLRTRQIARDAVPLDLTPREFELLEYLVRHQGEPVSRDMLARDVWREPHRTTLDNVIDVHIARLRKKVDAEFDTKLIHTVRGVGFMFRESVA
jgi:two-component system, OmpR family, copper resistance phosphate regulon response regulator CusR